MGHHPHQEYFDFLSEYPPDERSLHSHYLNIIYWTPIRAAYQYLLPPLPKTINAAGGSALMEEILLDFLEDIKELSTREITLTYLIYSYKIAVDQLYQNWIYHHPIGLPPMPDLISRKIVEMMDYFFRMQIWGESIDSLRNLIEYSASKEGIPISGADLILYSSILGAVEEGCRGPI